jgi:predicted nucleic acid-binding protein
MNKIVINTSPLIVLFKSQLTYLLPQLFTEIIITAGVWGEIVKAGKIDIASQSLPNANWAKQVTISEISALILPWGIDLGESEVLTFALENIGYRAVIDDAAAARKVAKSLNIPFMGTLGILFLAKKQGLITSLDEPIEALQKSGLWLSNDLIQFLKEQDN